MKEISFYIDQMTCQACSSGIERALNRKDFCHSIQVHLLSKKAILTFDDVALIIGGRNIADHYFDNNQQVNFVDTDAFFLGNVARKATQSFYEYWNFHRSVPASLLPIKTTPTQFDQSIKKLKVDPQWTAYDDVIDTLIAKYRHKKIRFCGDMPYSLPTNQKKYRIQISTNPSLTHLERFSTLHITTFTSRQLTLCPEKKG